VPPPSYSERLLAELDAIADAYNAILGDSDIRYVNPNRAGSTVVFVAAADWGEAPSPVCLNNQPPCASIARRSTLSCAASAARIPSASASHRRVEPSTSVDRNVTTPKGAAAGGADTPAESHNRHAPTSHIGRIRPRTPTPRGTAQRATARDRTGDKADVGWREVTRCWRERCS
jgi:hypothetical protein